MSSCRWKRCTASFSDIPPAGRAGVRWLVPRRGAVPLRLLLAARRGQNLLFPARPRNQSGILPSRYPENHRKCGQVGRSRQLADHPRLLLHRRHHRIPGGQGPAHRPILSCSYIRSRVFSGGGCYAENKGCQYRRRSKAIGYNTDGSRLYVIKTDGTDSQLLASYIS